MKGLEVLAELFVADLQSPILAEPGERSLDNVAEFPQPTAVLLVLAGQQTDDATLQSGRDIGGRSIGTVALKDLRAMAWSASRSLDLRDLVEHVDGRDAIVHVGWSGANDQGNAFGIRD